MQATFRLHGPLNDFVGPEYRDRDFLHSFRFPGTVKDFFESLGIPHPEIGRILVNGKVSSFETLIQDEDRIELFACDPGERELDLPCMPAGEPRFVLDVHLGTLANYLRLLGMDTLYRNDYQDEELARISAEENRVLLTRDIGLLKRKVVRFGYLLRSTKPGEQLNEIALRYLRCQALRPFTRCVRCNGGLHLVSKTEVLDRLPERVAAWADDFRQCDSCGQVYWEGSHMERMKKIVSTVAKVLEEAREKE